MAKEMKWSMERMNAYFQAALNMMPLEPAFSGPEKLPQFFENVEKTLCKETNLQHLSTSYMMRLSS